MSFDITKLQPVLDKLKTPGDATSEYAMFKSSSLMAKIIMVLGMLAFLGSLIADGFGANTHQGALIGAIVAILAKVLDLLGALGYNSGRVAIKTAAADATVAVAQAQTPMGPPADAEPPVAK